MENERLTILEAKELYTKAINSNDEKVFKECMDRVILGTLYFPYEFFEEIKLSIFANSRFDEEDIKSVIVETWIEKIHNGYLLQFTKRNLKWRKIIDDHFINKVINKLIGEERVDIRKLYASKYDLYRLFSTFLELKNKGKDFNYLDVINTANEKEKHYNYFNIPEIGLYDLFERAYNNLNITDEDDVDPNLADTYYPYYKLFLNSAMFSELSESLAYDDSFDEVLQKECVKDLVKDIDTVIDNERNSVIFHKIYGVDRGQMRVRDDLAKEYKVSSSRISDIEKRSLVRIRKSDIPKKYKDVLD